MDVVLYRRGMAASIRRRIYDVVRRRLYDVITTSHSTSHVAHRTSIRRLWELSRQKESPTTSQNDVYRPFRWPRRSWRRGTRDDIEFPGGYENEMVRSYKL